MENRKIVVIGGGTVFHVRPHLALSAPAYGRTSQKIAKMALDRFDGKMDVQLYNTKMAGGGKVTWSGGNVEGEASNLETNEDIARLVEELNKDLSVKIVFFNPALVDYTGLVIPKDINKTEESGKYGARLKTSEGSRMMLLEPAEKIVGNLRKDRKDMLVVGFKTTSGASEDEQYVAALDLMKRNSLNLVLANDVKTRVNMIVTPEEARYHVTTDREDALRNLVDMAYYRSHLTFTRSTVVDGNPVPWDSPEVYPALREVVEHCIKSNAYKPFNGATVGHFACKLSDTEFLTSIRKSNFNDLHKNGLVRIKTDGPDTVIAYGAKPSVGGQSQRIIFTEHRDYDCIVHFHCPIKPDSQVPVVSQREYECGSHQCGKNTSDGLKRFELPDGSSISAVMLDQHGPNIVFHHDVDPKLVIDFIKANFDLSEKTGGKAGFGVSASRGKDVFVLDDDFDL